MSVRSAQRKKNKPALAVWKFASCDGCQLSLLDCEDELIGLANEVRIAYFREVTRTKAHGPYDLSLVDGSISTPDDAQKVLQVRHASKFVVSIGACATAGGIQALRNFKDVKEFTSVVYARPEYIEALSASTPISAHIRVDFELRGCPVNKRQLLDVIRAYLHGNRPNISSASVCMECKRRGNVCVMVAQGIPCLGPVTQDGCGGALCPSYQRGCYGCFGPMETPNTSSLSGGWRRLGAKEQQLVQAFRNVNAGAEAFRRESEAHEK